MLWCETILVNLQGGNNVLQPARVKRTEVLLKAIMISHKGPGLLRVSEGLQGLPRYTLQVEPQNVLVSDSTFY